MTAAVKFHSVPQNSSEGQSYTVTVDLRSSSSNRSYSILKRVGIGLLIPVVIGVVATIIYFLTEASKESASSSNTTETSTGYSVFADSIEPPASESLQSLHNIVRLVTTDSNGYYNCDPAFQAHWGRFGECGTSANECMRNSIKLFGKLFCKPPTNSFGYIDDTSEKCENNYFVLARCDM